MQQLGSGSNSGSSNMQKQKQKGAGAAVPCGWQQQEDTMNEQCLAAAAAAGISSSALKAAAVRACSEPCETTAAGPVRGAIVISSIGSSNTCGTCYGSDGYTWRQNDMPIQQLLQCSSKSAMNRSCSQLHSNHSSQQAARL
jgi:hypothetical protein